MSPCPPPKQCPWDLISFILIRGPYSLPHYKVSSVIWWKLSLFCLKFLLISVVFGGLVGPLWWWTPGHCPDAHRVSPPLNIHALWGRNLWCINKKFQPKWFPAFGTISFSSNTRGWYEAPMVDNRGINFFRGQGGMKAGIDCHSWTFLLFCPISL